MATVSLAEAEQICTAAEFRLVTDATRPAITSFSEGMLKKKVERARKLRDKWNDQATGQRRRTQKEQGARETDAAKRSRRKAQLFGEVLQRFEKQLAKVEATGETEGSSAPARKKTTRSKRTAGHREERSRVKEELGLRQSAINKSDGGRNKKGSKKSAANAASADVKTAPKRKKKSKAASKPESEQASSSTQPALPQKEAAPKKAKKRRPIPVPAAIADLAQADRKGQRSAQTAAKQTRIKRSGVNTRVRGHVSARTKRAQGRRDSRG